MMLKHLVDTTPAFNSSHLDQDAQDKQTVVFVRLRRCFRVGVLSAVPVDEMQLRGMMKQIS